MPRFRRFNAAPQGVFIELEGCLLDETCSTTAAAVKQLFKEKGVDISEEEAASGNGSLAGADATTKKSHLRHVLFSTCADKWKAATGAEPTEWDLEALFKEFARCVRDCAHKCKAVTGAVDCVSMLQGKGIKVGITSDFNAEGMEPWMRIAHANGIEVDAAMSCADVANPGGRDGPFVCVPPEPWRCYALAARLNIFPTDTCVRVSHTTYGVEEGLNAGMWTVGLKTGPPVPFSGPGETEPQKNRRVEDGFYSLGCHYVIDGVWDLPRVMDDIEARMARGDKP